MSQTEHNVNINSARTGHIPSDKNELRKRYEKYKKILKNLTIMSDVFMRNVLKERACTEYILQVIMARRDLRVTEQVIQMDCKNLQGRSAILDCVARDAEDKRYNIEIQQDSEGASPKRARYHSSLMDMNTLEAGQDFEQLPESYVIFITRSDAAGYGLPICHIERVIKEAGEDFMDGAHIIYVNSSMQDDTELGRLMHDLRCRESHEMYSKILVKRVYELKETQKGVESMCREMEEIYNEGMAKGIESMRNEMDEVYNEGMAKGINEGMAAGEKIGIMKMKKEAAVSMAENGMLIDMIAEILKESVRVIQEWLSEGTAGN